MEQANKAEKQKEVEDAKHREIEDEGSTKIARIQQVKAENSTSDSTGFVWSGKVTMKTAIFDLVKESQGISEKLF